MFAYYLFIDYFYKKRNNFNFDIKTIIVQKKFDGLFGLITFASLFVALSAIFILSIVRSSIDIYLKNDLGETLPSTYILDVQNSQVEQIKKYNNKITLFPNIRARILEIDNLNIQEELSKKDTSIDRELGREFNLTYRNYLLNTEKIVEPIFGYDISNIQKGELSLEKSFADRANIKINSNLKFSVQGIVFSAKVTSIREADSRSGLPFFYFVFPKEELEKFPATFFGYVDLSESEMENLKTFLAKNFPNVSFINTLSIQETAKKVVDFMIVIILVITVPAIILSTMLICTIVINNVKDRKRDSARLMILGKDIFSVRNIFILESVSIFILSAFFSYILALIVSNYVVLNYLKVNKIVLFDAVSFYVFFTILFSIIALSFYLWKKDRKSLKEYLNYEENN
jgi:putative ABC transport system permease protein